MLLVFDVSGWVGHICVTTETKLWQGEDNYEKKENVNYEKKENVINTLWLLQKLSYTDKWPPLYPKSELKLILQKCNNGFIKMKIPQPECKADPCSFTSPMGQLSSWQKDSQ